MRKKQTHVKGENAIVLLEEATHLLRRCPPAYWGAYLIGTAPFLVMLLYFIAEMAQSPHARQAAPMSALLTALAFFWMKAWQSRFCSCLMALTADDAPPAFTWKLWLRTFRNQMILQPSALLMVPAAAAVMLPLGHVYGFYQNVSALDYGRDLSVRDLFKEASRQATRWPLQANIIITILAALSFIVFIDLYAACAQVPMLLKSLLGIETEFSRSYYAMLNTTFFSIVACLTWLCIDPILKAAFTLRCFYGQSLKSGEDLKRVFPLPRTSAALAGLLLAGACLPGAHAADLPEAPDAGELDASIERVINTREFMWRFPPEMLPEDAAASGGFWSDMRLKFGEYVRDTFRWIADTTKGTLDWIGRVWKRLFGGKGRTRQPSDWSMPSIFGGLTQLLLWILLAALVTLAIVLGVRAWKKRRPEATLPQVDQVSAVPDLRQENVSADALHEDEWLKLAHELIDQGEYRLALRAYYLAGLAHLAERDVVRLARFKSNRDYVREVDRRGRAWPDVQAAFREHVLGFDRVWYGTHEADRASLAHFETNLQTIRSC